MAEVEEVFKKQPFSYERKKVDTDEFDCCFYFTEGKDPYLYCFKDEGCHIIYHRFLPEDYEDLGLYNEERIVRQTTCLPAKAGGSIYFKEGVV